MLAGLLGSTMIAGNLGAATAPQGRMEEWAIQRWSTAEGMPQNSVTSVAEDSSGMLCLATFGGLVRFDGYAMQVTTVADDPNLGTNRLLSVFATTDGTLLAGTEDHGLLAIVGRRVTAVGGCPEAATLTVVGFAPGLDGDVWLATNRGVARYRGNTLELPWPAARGMMNSIARAADGTLCVAATNGAWIFGKGEPVHWPGRPLNSVVIAPDGMVVMAGPQGVVRVDGNGVAPLLDTEVTRPGCLAIAANGDLFVAGAKDFSRCQLSPPRRLQARSLPAPGRSILEDRNGRIWVGTDGAGLLCLRRADLERAGVGRSTLVVADNRGGWYRASHNRLFHVAADGGQHQLLQVNVDIDALARTASGEVLLALGHEIRRLVDGDHVPTDCSVDRDRHGRIVAIDASAPDTIWFGTDLGTIGRHRDGKTVLWQPPELAAGAIHCFLHARDATWVGTTHGVLYTTDDGAHWQALQAGRDIAPGEVRGLASDGRGGVWIGSYGGGLTCWHPGRIHRIARRHGLPSNDVCQLEIDRERGELFVNTNVGVSRCLLSDLYALMARRSPAVPCELLVPPDSTSIEGNGFMWPSSCRLADGTWLFCCLDDVVAVPPDHTSVPRPPLVARVETQSTSSDRDGDQPPTRHLRFQFGAPAFENASFVTFRHRLRGHDVDWVLDGHKRTAEYFDLPGGDYVIEVAAAGPGAEWGPAASLAVHVPPHWHEYPATWAAGLAGLAVAVLAIGRLASFRQTRNNRLLRAAVQARTEDLEREVARRRDAERRLQAAHDELERRVAARTEELRDALLQLESDARERSDLQGQVDQLQRLESIGRLAGGIAHDFNNLLTVVRSATELIRVAPDNPNTDDLLASIERAAMQGTRLTQQLLTFARRQTLRREVFDLRDLVRNNVQMLRRLVSANIELVTSLPDNPVVIEADRAQIEQVIVNLCVNARDAMPAGGRLTVTVATGANQQGRCHGVLRVTDTGVGMSKEVAARACEPFFSTKNRSTNSGLGLSTCYGIVKRLDGDLRIDSAPGKGTTIEITVPCTDKPLPTAELEIPRPQRLTGKVLVVEDHPEVRAALARLLEQLGCHVEAVGNGAEALRALDQSRTFDFVVSDISMPGVHGSELAASMRALNPQLPIVFVSGNPDPDGEYGRLRTLGYEVLQKPPEPALLVTAILRARDAAANPGSVSGS